MKAHQAAYILEQYVDAANRWSAIFGENDLSPENLHCDGEISRSQAAAKARELNNTRAALEHYCLNNWLDTPECVY
jgi:hypothetical protein